MIKNLRPQLTEAGKIKIGGLGELRKSKGGNDYRLPQKYDHFQITKTNRNEAGDLEIDTDLMDLLQPDEDNFIRAIPLVLHSDNIDEVFPTAYAIYKGSRCFCRGDGETALRREVINDEYTGKVKKMECPCANLDAEGSARCKPNGKLYCSIAVGNSAVAGAVHIWRTTSLISVQRMYGSLMQILEICGTLRGIPLWLKVSPTRVEPKGQGAITVYCCHVELRGADLITIQEQALRAVEMRRKLQAPHGYARLLSAPGEHETDEEQAEIEAEYYTIDRETGEVQNEKQETKKIIKEMKTKKKQKKGGDEPEPTKGSEKSSSMF